jgi:undecaprenyl-diphosphatase
VSVLEAIVLGIVQGVTEFLPVSSSAHLRFVPAMLGWEDPGAAFTAVTQLGTEAAVLIYFRHDLWAAVTGWSRSLYDRSARGTFDARLGWYLIVATIPISIFGLAFRNQIETGARNLYIVGSVLVGFALILLWADRRSRHDREIAELSFRDGVIIGCAQSLALIPGVSRSGATMTAGFLLGLERPAAARFSFLLAVPAVLLSGFFQLWAIWTGREDEPPDPLGRQAVAAPPDPPLEIVALGTVVAFIVGYLVIAWLLRFLTTHTVALFVGYRVIIGSLVLALTASGLIS